MDLGENEDGNDYYEIISKKSVIPDLVIYNKTFNKNWDSFRRNKYKTK